ncbi:MAG: hypothetical protein JRG94_00020 [Deltaproteobacteria bacterium]|nr:hypothetical protein [Deltaproteobacteria bacterium]
MSGKVAARRIALGCIAGGILIVVSGCRGPLAPTPGFGDEVRANRNAMVENPDAGTQNTELAEGLMPSTAEGVIENYLRNEKAENQERRQKSSKQSDLKF